MTKREMIKAIQVAEARAWKQLQDDKKLFGETSAITDITRNKWNPLFELREALGIPGLGVSDLIREDLLP